MRVFNDTASSPHVPPGLHRSMCRLRCDDATAGQRPSVPPAGSLRPSRSRRAGTRRRYAHWRRSARGPARSRVAGWGRRPRPCPGRRPPSGTVGEPLEEAYPVLVCHCLPPVGMQHRRTGRQDFDPRQAQVHRTGSLADEGTWALNACVPTPHLPVMAGLDPAICPRPGVFPCKPARLRADPIVTGQMAGPDPIGVRISAVREK